MEIYNKIIRSFSGSNNRKELEQIELWKNEAQENLDIIQELKAIHEASEGLKDYTPVDKDKAWGNINSKLTSAPNPNKWLALLGLLILLSGITYFNFFKSSDTESKQQVFASAEKLMEFSLKDGTNVRLDKSSSVKVIDERYVELNGRALFDVTSTKDKDNFTVKINGGKVTVLGTSFSVLSKDNIFEVVVLEGHVRVDYNGRSVDLYANDVLRSSQSDLTVSKNTYANSMSWDNNEIVFENEQLQTVLSDLSRHFKTEISIATKVNDHSNCRLTSTFSNPNIQDVLEELKIIFKANFIKKGNSYVITSLNCE